MLSVIRENVRLAPYTTFRIGGIARYFADIDHEDQLREAVQFAAQLELPVFVLGGGSNVLIADAGFSGLVIHIVNKGITFQKAKKDVALVTAAAGEDWDQLVQQCVARNLAGLECLSGIPGLVGGTPIQNVGAYGQEVSETIVSLRAFDRQASRVVEMTNADCQFSYRASIFNTTQRNRYIMLSVTYKLKPNGAPTLRYADLHRHFDPAGNAPTLSQVRAAVLAIRARKGMVILPNDPDCQSAGSFFKNPLVSPEKFAQLAANAADAMPHFPAAEGQVKIPAAWLIEQAGFAKGYEQGRVGISSKHSLALINRSNATAAELLALVERIQRQVQERFGIALVPEPVQIGFKNQTLPVATTTPARPDDEPLKTDPTDSWPPPAKARRPASKPAHNPLKSERKKWFV